MEMGYLYVSILNLWCALLKRANLTAIDEANMAANSKIYIKSPLTLSVGRTEVNVTYDPALTMVRVGVFLVLTINAKCVRVVGGNNYIFNGIYK